MADFKEKDYQKGFNDGYLIAKHLPELSEQLSRIDIDSSRFEGFKDGREQYALEDKDKQKVKEELSWQRPNRLDELSKEIGKERDKTKDKDDLEREMR